MKKVITTEDLKKPEIKKIITEKAKEKLQKSFENVTLFDNEIEKKIETAVAPLIEQKIKYTIDIPKSLS